jgi:dTDP-4-dehydrorhamnose reductase
MKILVTGANGFLGRHLVKKLLDEGFSVLATGRGPSRLPFAENGNFRYVPADLEGENALQLAMGLERPEVVVHTAAMTQADYCEQDQEHCFDVNVSGTARLLVDAENIGSFFIFLSTDFVFDGTRGPYAEDNAPNPLNWYGFTKVQAEAMVAASEIPWAIVRTCLVFGAPLEGDRPNILSWVQASLQEGKPIQVVDDQWRTPTYIGDLVQGILLVIRHKARGIFHISGKDLLSPYEMALETARVCGLPAGLISRTDASAFSQPAKRPARTGLDISKARRELGFHPIDFKQALKIIFPFS